MSNPPPPPPELFPGNESVILTNTDSRLASIEQRLHIVEQYLTQHTQSQNNSFASFASLHMSNLEGPNNSVINTTNVANNNNSFVSTASSGGKNKTKSNKKKKSKNQTKRKRKV